MVEFPPEFPFVRRPGKPPVVETPKSDNPPAPPQPAAVDKSTSAPQVLSDEPVAELPPVEIPLPAIPRKHFIERRKFKRDRLTAYALVHIDGAKAPPAKVSLVDISIAGTRFHSNHRMDIGDRLQIRVEVGPFRWTTRMRVIHCTPYDRENCLIGCAFLRTELLRPWPAAA
jgi:hypothetical protein